MKKSNHNNLVFILLGAVFVTLAVVGYQDQEPWPNATTFLVAGILLIFIGTLAEVAKRRKGDRE